MRLLIPASLTFLLTSTSLYAETLPDALLKAYKSNPTLNGARAGLKAVDESISQARASGLPSMSATGSYNQQFESLVSSFGQPRRAGDINIGLSVPIYAGGAVKNAIRAADVRSAQGRDTLRGTESSLFSQVVAAYMDVIQNEALVGLNQKQVSVLAVNLQATKDRFQVGDLTRTDIAQSEARFAAANSALDNAQANLISAREVYIQLVGEAPVALEAPPSLPNFPASPEDAVQVAVASNPDLNAADKAIDAARFDTSVARASRLPRIGLTGSANYINYFHSLKGSFSGSNPEQTYKTATLGAQVTIPIYQGGGPSAQVRAANDRTSQALERKVEVERSVIEQARSAFASWRASLEVIDSSKKQVSAAQLSLEGVKAENTVGNRTILDILNAEQELISAQTQLIQAQRNAYVSGFTLLAAMGKAQAKDLGLEGGAFYNPLENYNAARHHVSDWSDGPPPSLQSTRTIDIPAQTPALTTK